MSSYYQHIETGYAIVNKSDFQKQIKQVHGNKIVPLSSEVYEADGLYTYEINAKISITTADCIPLLFFSSDTKGPIAAVHCGWRGVMLRITEKAREIFKDFSLEVNIGPSILQCCFEVKEDLIEAFHKENHTIQKYLITKNSKIYFNLVDYLIENQLKGVKVHRENSRCTVCSTPQLPSYRRNKSTDPQIVSWIMKKA